MKGGETQGLGEKPASGKSQQQRDGCRKKKRLKIQKSQHENICHVQQQQWQCCVNDKRAPPLPFNLFSVMPSSGASTALILERPAC